MKLTGDRIRSDESSEFISKYAHDAICKCGSGTYSSSCPTRKVLETQIRVAQETGETTMFLKVLGIFNDTINKYLEDGMEDWAFTVEAFKQILIEELGRSCEKEPW